MNAGLLMELAESKARMAAQGIQHQSGIEMLREELELCRVKLDRTEAERDAALHLLAQAVAERQESLNFHAEQLRLFNAGYFAARDRKPYVDDGNYPPGAWQNGWVAGACELGTLVPVARAEQAESERDQLRQQLAQAQAQCAVWQRAAEVADRERANLGNLAEDQATRAERAEAGREAVPVAAIARVEKVARYLLSQTGRGAGGPAVDDFLAIQAWLANQPQPEVQP